MPDWFSQFESDDWFSQFESDDWFSQFDIPRPTLPELPSPFKKLPAFQPTRESGYEGPFSFDPLRRSLGANTGNFIAGLASGPFSSEETWQSPYGKAGAITGSALDLGLIGKGAQLLKRSLSKTPKVKIPEILPPEVIPGKRRLGAAPEPKGLLEEAKNPEIIPMVQEGPRFIAGKRGVAETGKTYQPYMPDDFSVTQRMGRIDDLLDQSTASRVGPFEAAEIGIESAGRPINPNQMQDPVFKQIYLNLINRGHTPTDAYNQANKAVNEMIQIEHRTLRGAEIPLGERKPVYSGPMRAEIEPPIPGSKVETKPIERVETGYPQTGPVRTITDPKGKKAKEILKNTKKINQAVTSNPITAEVVKYPEAIEEASKRLSWGSKFKQFYRNSVRNSIESEIEKMGEAGRKIKMQLAQASQLARQRASIWDEPYNQIARDLSPKEVDEFFSVIEGGTSTNEKVNRAVELAKLVDQQRTSVIENVKLLNPETSKPVKPITNYAPRIYPEGFWDNPKQVYFALKQKFPNLADDVIEKISLGKTDPEIVNRVMQSSGVDRDTADLILKLGRERGERAISSQHSRELNLPGYRRDINVFKEHNWDIAKRTSEQEVFGRLDIADPNSPLGQLVNQTPNPRYTEDLLKIVLGREEKTRFSRQLDSVNRFASGLSSSLYLSLFPISNTANLITIPLNAGLKNTVKAITDVIALNRGTTRAFASESGALYNITRGIIEHAGKGPIAKGISASENFNRTVAASAGKSAVEDLFATLKTGKIRQSDRQFLEDLTLTPIDELLKQKDLTVQQVRNAGGRMAELTQGLGESRKVPVYWNSPYFQLPLIFKKYAFQQTGILKDAIKRDPVKNIPLLLASSQIFGEMIGDTKAGIRGLVKTGISGDTEAIKKEIEQRGNYLGEYLKTDNKTVTRLIDNLMQSWALGLMSDLFFISTGTADKMAYDLLGPFIGTGLTAFESGRKAITGDPRMLGRETLKRIPYIGPGLQRTLLPTEFQKKQDLPQISAPKVSRP